jgi:N-methylhydantoinase A
MGGGITTISTQKGYDLREFSLVAFGGASGLHAAELADELGMKRIIIPLFPANFSAIGMVLADVRYDYVRTVLRPVKDITETEYNSFFDEMKKEAVIHLAKEGFDQDTIVFGGISDMRYAGQAWELSVLIPTNIASTDDFINVVQDFHNAHTRTYGYCLSEEEVMFVNLRLYAIGKMPTIEFKKEELVQNVSDKALKGMRKIVVDQDYRKVRIYDREILTPGCVVKGPAIIEEYASNTLVPSNRLATIDQFRNIVIEAASVD